MPGVRPKSPASPLPALPRIWTTLLTSSSKVVAAASSARAARAKATSNRKAKAGAEEKTHRRGRGEYGETASTTRPRNLPPPPIIRELGKTRCSWITANSEPLYITFHDEEWGVPVHDDRELFELLTLSQALAELTWPVILSRRDEFREMIEGLNNASVSEFAGKEINQLLRSNGSMLLSEQKIGAVVSNAKQMQKVAFEFGSFSNYCWSFVNHRPITNSFRYARQVPTKTPRSEAMSKDMMRRGFQCVGPTAIYSFMQVAGIVNDHLFCCFRSQTCSSQPSRGAPDKSVGAEPALVAERSLSSSGSDGGFRE